jgi:hypothetical protein
MFFWIVVWGVVFGTLAGLVTNSKGRGWGEGIVLGGLLGIFGLIIVAFFKPITTPLERPITSGKPSPAPGWYQDGSRGLRWWNGSAWTDASPPPSLPPT